MNIAIIPARGGSKRIPQKNIKDFFGKPMIAWSIEAAVESNCFDQVIVSTDNQEIAEVAKSYGAAVPFIRPANLSGDFAGTMPVMRHAVKYLDNKGLDTNFVCCIYATAPFLKVETIREGKERLEKSNASYAFTVATYASPIQRALKVSKEGRAKMFYPEFFDSRSQDLEEAYHDAGQLYWGTKSAWLNSEDLFAKHSLPIILPRYLVQDIDTYEDWERAELMFEALNR